MASFMDSVKEIFTTSINALERTFNRAKKASSFKLNEMDVVARRRDAISELGEKVYSLAQAEVALPEELAELIAEIRAMDDGLVNARKEHEEWKKTTAEKAEAEKAQLEEQRRLRAIEQEKQRIQARAQAEAKRAERDQLMAQKRAEAMQRAEEQKRLKEAQKNARDAANQANPAPQAPVQNYAGDPYEGRSAAEKAALERAAAMKAAAEAAARAEEEMLNSAKYPADSE